MPVKEVGTQDCVVRCVYEPCSTALQVLYAAANGGARSYGDKKTDVGISYLSAVRLCSEKLEPVAGWPPSS